MFTDTKISKNWCELIPAYGRDYSSAAKAEADFRAGKDFEGSIELGFRKCSIRDFAPGTIVLLRYNRLERVASVKV